MAQPIHCDVHNREHLADVIVQQIPTGDSFAACADGYVELCRSVVEAADAPEVEATDADALARLDALGSPADPPTSPASSGADDPPAGPPTNDAGGPGATVTAIEAPADPDGPLEPDLTGSVDPGGSAG